MLKWQDRRKRASNVQQPEVVSLTLGSATLLFTAPAYPSATDDLSNARKVIAKRFIIVFEWPQSLELCHRCMRFTLLFRVGLDG